MIGEYHIEVELSMGKFIGKGCSIIKNYSGDFKKGNFRGMQNYRG